MWSSDYSLEIDTAADLALLQAKTNISAYPPLQFANSLDLSRGDSICYICYNPLINYCCLHYTTLLSINRELNSTGLKRCMQYFGETVPGNSGGPVLNTFGEVIGIIKGRIIINDVISNRGCAFPILTFENCLRDESGLGFMRWVWTGMKSELRFMGWMGVLSLNWDFWDEWDS